MIATAGILFGTTISAGVDHLALSLFFFSFGPFGTRASLTTPFPGSGLRAGILFCIRLETARLALVHKITSRAVQPKPCQ